jgi:uncharacterized cupredoxin-like copper-binding protein
MDIREQKSAWAGLCLAIMIAAGPLWAEAALRHGHLIQIEQLSFHPDSVEVPGDGFAVLIVQNREVGPIEHEVLSQDLFESGTLIAVQGTGTIEYNGKKVARVLLFPGEEAVIWYYAVKGRTYTYQCNLNGHAMLGTIQAK